MVGSHGLYVWRRVAYCGCLRFSASSTDYPSTEALALRSIALANGRGWRNALGGRCDGRHGGRISLRQYLVSPLDRKYIADMVLCWRCTWFVQFVDATNQWRSV